jgi:hypothetical protein
LWRLADSDANAHTYPDADTNSHADAERGVSE